MPERHEYALTEFTTTAGSRPISSRSRRSSDPFDDYEAPPQNPFVDQTDHLANTQPSQPYDAASNNLLAAENEQHHAHGPAFPREWKWELTAWLVAAVSLVSLIIVFAVYGDKPLREWGADITPATTVAILSQVGQTAILAPVTACICQSMWLWLDEESRVAHQANANGHQPRLITMQRYDDGSRGPISSLILLWQRPDALLVWLGTINTLLIIIFVSFAQQALQLPTREFNLTNEGTDLIPRALQYRAPQPAVSQIIPSTLNTYTYGSVADQMSVAIIDGLLRPGISPSDVTESCVTGNCTWQDYQSMGVCSTITDVSSTITARCRKRTTQFYPAGCNYSVPAINRNPTARKTVLQASKLGQTLWVGASDTQDYTSPGLNTLIQFYVIYVPDFIIWDSLDPTEDHKDELVALQATLSLCLNKYHTDMTFGVTDTNLVSKETDLDWQTSSETFERVSFDTVTVTHDAETFWMSGLNQGSFYKYLSLQTFTGSASMRSEERDGGGNFTENDVVRVIAASLYDDRAGMPGLTKLLDNLAVSMSNALRTTTDVPDNIRGTPSSFEVYIQIEWAWLIVPIAAVGLSLVFLLLTMYLSRKRKIPAWKSSLLAVVLGLTSEARRDWGAIRRPREMEETAKGRSIRLEANGGQWQMVKAD